MKTRDLNIVREDEIKINTNTGKDEIGNVKWNVIVDKAGGERSIYSVAALSSGGAEKVCLAKVYAAKYAFAGPGWPANVEEPDLVSDGFRTKVLKMVKWCLESE